MWFLAMYILFFIVISHICGLKMRFSASSLSSLSEKSIFGHFEVIFPNVKTFLRAGVLFRVSTFKEEYFIENMSRLAGFRKVIQFSAKLLILAIFGYLGLPS